MNAKTPITFTAYQLIALAPERGDGKPFRRALEIIRAARDLAARYPDMTFSSGRWSGDGDANGVGDYPFLRLYRGGKQVATLEVCRNGMYGDGDRWELTGEHVADNAPRHRDPRVWRGSWEKLLAYIVEKDALRLDNPQEQFDKKSKELFNEYASKLHTVSKKAERLVSDLRRESLNVAMGMGNTPAVNALRGEVPDWVALVEATQAEFNAANYGLAASFGDVKHVNRSLLDHRMAELKKVVAAFNRESVDASSSWY